MWFWNEGQSIPEDKDLSWVKTKNLKRQKDALAPFCGGYTLIKDRVGNGKKFPINKVYRLDLDAVRSGMEIMAKRHHMRFSNIIEDNYGFDDADLFLQCCLLGDLRYD